MLEVGLVVPMRLLLCIGCSGLFSVTLCWLYARWRARGLVRGRSAPAPGAHLAPQLALGGGLLAGLLLGPGGLGVLAPPVHESLFVDGHDARASLAELDARQVEEREALERTGVSEVAGAELRVSHDEQRARALQRLSDSVARTRGPTDSAWLALGAIGVFGGVWIGRDAPRWGVREVGVGLAAVAFSALPTAVLAQRLLDLSLLSSIGLGLAVSAGGAGAALRRVAGRRGDSESGLLVPMMVMSAVGVGAVAWNGSLGVLGLLVALVVGGMTRVVAVSPGIRRVVRRVLLWCVWPGLSCALVVRTDPVGALMGFVDTDGVFGGTAVSAAVFLGASVLLVGGGHAIGVWVGNQIFSDRPRGFWDSMSAWIDAHGRGVGRCQVLLGLVLLGAGLLDPGEPACAIALFALGVQALAGEALLPAWRKRELTRP